MLTASGTFLYQPNYTKDLLDMARMTNAKLFVTSMELNVNYNKRVGGLFPILFFIVH